MMATQPPKVRAEHILKMMDIIQPGDIICRKYTYYLDSILIPGEFSHSGLVFDSSKMGHSIAEGCQYIHPIDFVKDTDGFIICRPKYEKPADLVRVFDLAKWYIDNKVQYDFMFNDIKKLYCHEFTCRCLERAGIAIPMVDKKFGIWPFSFERMLYLADAIINNTQTVYRFDG